MQTPRNFNRAGDAATIHALYSRLAALGVWVVIREDGDSKVVVVRRKGYSEELILPVSYSLDYPTEFIWLDKTTTDAIINRYGYLIGERA